MQGVAIYWQREELYFPTIRTTCKWTITAKSPHTFSWANKYDRDLYSNTEAKNAHLAQIISPEIKVSTEAIFYYKRFEPTD